MSGASANNNKWNDTAVKDLVFAILVSKDGGSNISADWNQVEQLMNRWGHGFTKSAMTQQWSKKILKEFRERHPDVAGPSTSAGGAAKKATPRKPRTPKTPASGTTASGKKRRATNADDDDEEEEKEEDTPPGQTNTADLMARNKTPRSSANKRVKYADADANDNEADDEDEDDVPASRPIKTEQHDQGFDDQEEGI